MYPKEPSTCLLTLFECCKRQWQCAKTKSKRASALHIQRLWYEVDVRHKVLPLDLLSAPEGHHHLTQLLAYLHPHLQQPDTV